MTPDDRPSKRWEIPPASEQVRQRFSRLARYMLIFTPLMLILNFWQIDAEPWSWIKLAVMAIGTTVLIVCGTRLTLWQRDEYWRERGRDPKHPERFPQGRPD